jgi:predicted deacylase
MLRAPFEGDTERPTVVACHTVIRHAGARGFTLLDKERRGTRVRAGDVLGQVVHAFTGDVLREIRAPREGFMIHAGASWPVVPEGYPLAILGDVIS